MTGTNNLGTSYSSKVDVNRMWIIILQQMVWLDLGTGSMCQTISSSRSLSCGNLVLSSLQVTRDIRRF